MSPGEDGLIGIPFPEHSNELLSCLNAQRRAGLLCDLTLTSRGARYSTHRSVMAAVSLYFRKLFGAEEGESGDLGAGGGCSVCQLDCVAPDALGALLEFAYTATLTIRSSGMREVLKAAQLLGIQCVADACRDILGEADEEQEDVHNEDTAHGSRRKRDRRQVSRSTLFDPQLVYRSPPSSPLADSRPSCTTAPPSPEYNENFAAVGQNGEPQHSSREADVAVNGNVHWAQQAAPLAPAAEDRLSEEEDKAEFRDGADSGPPGTRPFECPLCHKAFVREDHLQRHRKGHSCLEVRTRRPRRAVAPGPGLGSQLLDPHSLGHASTFPRSPPPPRGNSSVHPLLYPPDGSDPPIPMHAMSLLGPPGLPYRNLLWRSMGMPGGGAEEPGAPDPSRGLQPHQARWGEEEDDNDDEEEEEEDDEEEE
ncbi:zinc finger and BTB domain-containing protein 7B-like [Scleropages formosus]|uniref:Zinc finger and BTB domain-containing protein 7B-like n=1 Tax=Scleropages formosus TaxID=113540 RepID=A0A0P7VYS5_SCLFO|nr:zinc finger and BTB domain-containing protein 7B-like [Scleropages formosus]